MGHERNRGRYVVVVVVVVALAIIIHMIIYSVQYPPCSIVINFRMCRLLLLCKLGR